MIRDCGNCVESGKPEDCSRLKVLKETRGKLYPGCCYWTPNLKRSFPVIEPRTCDNCLSRHEKCCIGVDYGHPGCAYWKPTDKAFKALEREKLENPDPDPTKELEREDEEVNTCSSCEHENVHSSKEPCLNCRIFDKWRRLGEIKKDCDTCKHEDIPVDDEPCRTCTDFTHWAAPNIDHPDYYTSSKIEVWDAIAEWNLNYFRGCVVKYIARAGRKDSAKEIEDLKKAINYLNREIKRVSGNK